MSLYSQTYENVLLPTHNLVRSRNYAKHRRFLEASQWWSRDKIAEFQWKELSALLDHVFRSVPYYQRKYAAAGVQREDIRCLSDFARLPVLTRQEVNTYREELRSNAYHGKLDPYATGGSSGVPTRFYITTESYDWRMAASQRAYSWSGVRLGERTLYLWGAPIGEVSALITIKKQLHQFLQRQLIFNTFTQTPKMWQDIYEKASRFRPLLVIGYVSSLEGFAKFLADRKLSLPAVRSFICAAEPVYTPTRRFLEEVFQAPAFNTYGSREFMSIAGECAEHDGLHVNSENVVVETMLPAGDGPSDMLITDLHNYGMPFVRYTIGDLGILDPSPCRCGRALPRIRSIDGRVLDALRTTDGDVVPGEFFPHLLKDIPEIKEYQVRQTSLEEIKILAVVTGPLSSTSQECLHREIQKVFGSRTRATVHPVDDIPKLASGKRRTTIGLPASAQPDNQPCGSGNTH